MTLDDGTVSIQKDTPFGNLNVRGELGITKDGLLEVKKIDWRDTNPAVELITPDPNKLLQSINDKIRAAGLKVTDANVSGGQDTVKTAPR